MNNELESLGEPQYIQNITEDQGIGSVAIGDAIEDASIEVLLESGDKSNCDFSLVSECSDDGLLWRANDFGSPYFCTDHYFPQEQLGYEFYEV